MLQTFITRRLIAEKLQKDHFDDLVRLHLDPDVSRYLGGVRSPQDTQTYLESSTTHWDQFGFGLWALKTQDGRFAGRAGIRHILVEDAPEVEIAYALNQEFWGQGFASEITNALVDIGFRHLRLSSLVGVIVVEHTTSRRVLDKAGFIREREVVFYDHPCVLYRRKPASV